MNKIANPYAPRRKPRHRGWRRLCLLTSVCLVALGAVILLSGCNPPEESSSTPQDSPAPGDPGVGAVSLPMEPVSVSAGPHSAWVSHCHQSPEDLAWCQWIEFMQDPANAAWFHWKTTVVSSHRVERHTVWDRLAQCESQGRWHINTGNGYYGGIQFSLRSWRWVGGQGYPHHATKAEQIHRGRKLLALQGWRAWPACSKELGLR